MKRRYKAGDWFRVPLGAERDAVGIIARACQSRLFGYFFPVEAAHEMRADELRALRPRDAIASALFGGAGLEDARWRLIATSLPFDPQAWPFPQFASRGAFGRTWSLVAYDPESMRIERRTAIDERTAQTLPDARICTPDELEDLLRRAQSGTTAAQPLAVCEIRSPVDVTRLQLLGRGGRAQFSETLSARDLQTLGEFIEAHPNVELRVHGLPRFDLRRIRGFGALRGLVLDVPALENVDALESLGSLESLRLGPMRESVRLDVLHGLAHLRALELRGQRADVRAVARLQHLNVLELVDTPPLDLHDLASAAALRRLLIAHGENGARGVAALPALERLHLRNMPLQTLPDFSANVRLREIELRDITQLQDLTPLAGAPALRELRIEGMPQLNVPDFAPLSRCAQLQHISVDIGSKRKSREVYRLLRMGKNAS